MKAGFKRLLLRAFSYLNRLSPSHRADLLARALQKLTEYDTPERALRFLLDLDNRLYILQGSTAVLYGHGIHPKHRVTGYHDFFVKNLNEGDNVLDIGSGNGLLAHDIVQGVADIKVVGIELNEENVRFAREHYRHPNLRFIHGDALKDLPEEKFDAVILSNVLEHIEDRVSFLRKLIKKLSPEKILIRVPMYERDWRVPLKKELGVEYRLDRTHYTEYRLEEFLEEIRQAELETVHTECRWGEIWSVTRPVSMNRDND
jgi:2-polyprenyl-3-methyl-5-hydroxy-6-metoxy-1,4-benzoquinol methylase